MRGSSLCQIIVCSVLFFACAKKNYISTETSPLGEGSSKPQNPSADKDAVQSPNACESQILSQAVCFNFAWQKIPTEKQAGSFLLKFFSLEEADLLQDPVDAVSVVLWMPSMGHGSSPVKVTQLSRGVYLVERVYFIMPGEWEIFIRFKKNEILVDQAIQKVSI